MPSLFAFRNKQQASQKAADQISPGKRGLCLYGTLHAEGIRTFPFPDMKLFIALTPAILIGCAMFETWASIATQKQPAPPPASTTHIPARRPVPVFTFDGAPTTVAAVPTTATPWAVAQAQVSHPSKP